MKKTICILLCLPVILFAGCDNSPKIYSHGEVQKDSSDVWLLRKNGRKVNGIVESHAQHFFLNKPCLHRVDVIDGVDVGFKDYIDDECIGYMEYSNGQDTGTYYGKQGNNTYAMSMKDGIPDGICEVFDSDGKQIREIVFENGNPIKTYEFDSKGDKIIPVEEKLELVAYETGFYESVNYNSNEILYCPIVIMKFKNISESPITSHSQDDWIKVTATFLDKDEEWSTTFKYLVGPGDSPMSPGISRQCYLMSSRGYVSYRGIGSTNISCQLFINDKPFKTIQIANRISKTNVM